MEAANSVMEVAARIDGFLGGIPYFSQSVAALEFNGGMDVNLYANAARS